MEHDVITDAFYRTEIKTYKNIKWTRQKHVRLQVLGQYLTCVCLWESDCYLCTASGNDLHWSEAITDVDSAVLMSSGNVEDTRYPTVIWGIGRTRACIDSGLQTRAHITREHQPVQVPITQLTPFPVIMIIISPAAHSLPRSFFFSFLKRGIEQTGFIRGRVAFQNTSGLYWREDQSVDGWRVVPGGASRVQ